MHASASSLSSGSGVVFLWTAVPYRMTWRYGERGYRDLHLDAGHVCQNLYLAAEAVGCGVCAIAAFDDDVMNDLLGIDGNDQFLIYLATAGKKDDTTGTGTMRCAHRRHRKAAGYRDRAVDAIQRTACQRERHEGFIRAWERGHGSRGCGRSRTRTSGNRSDDRRQSRSGDRGAGIL